MTENGLVRFWRLGARDADARVAEILTNAHPEKTDAYIAQSAIVRFVDRCYRRLEATWRDSAVAGTVAAVNAEWSRASAPHHQRTIGFTLVMAVGTHVGFTLLQGARPGWFWLVIPGMALAFGLVLLAASRSAKSPN